MSIPRSNPPSNLIEGTVRLLRTGLAQKETGKDNQLAITIAPAGTEDAEKLTEVQVGTFVDDNSRKPPGCSLEGPPGYDAVDWNLKWISKTPYFKILNGEGIVGGMIVFGTGQGQCELGRIFVDPSYQNLGIGQQAMRLLFSTFPQVTRWTLGTPCWATRNQHFYEKLGFVEVGRTDLDPQLGWASVEYERGQSDE